MEEENIGVCMKAKVRDIERDRSVCKGKNKSKVIGN